jgi:4'-phosphopantetheinyl transferase
VSHDDVPARVHVTWLRSPGPDASTLTELVGEVAGTADGVRVTRSCRACGSDRHGKPHVRTPPGSPPLFVSLARSGAHAVVAVTDVGDVGVDVEVADRGGSGGRDDLVAWVRAESLVKATGHGLTIDPATLDVPRRTIDLDPPDGLVAALTVLSRRDLVVTAATR